MPRTKAPIDPAWTPHGVRALRGLLGMSQPAFAHALGVSLITVGAWENGRRKPGRMARRILARFLREQPENSLGVGAELPED